MIVDSGFSWAATVTDPEYRFPIQPWNTIVRVRSVMSDGRKSAYASEEINVAGKYQYNVLAEINIPSFAGGRFVNMAWTDADTVQRPSIRGGTVAAPYVGNINDSDLWNFVEKLTMNVEELDCPVEWFRDKWWKPDRAWFESPVFDFGEVLSGKLLGNIVKTVTDYSGDVANYDFDVANLDYINIEEIVNGNVHLSADLLGSTDGSTWKPVKFGDWVTLRYVKFTVEVLAASPLVDITIDSGYLCLDVPDLTEIGSTAVESGDLTKAVTFAKVFNVPPSVHCNAQGPQRAYAANITATGFDIGLESNPGTTTVNWFAKGF